MKYAHLADYSNKEESIKIQEWKHKRNVKIKNGYLEFTLRDCKDGTCSKCDERQSYIESVFKRKQIPIIWTDNQRIQLPLPKDGDNLTDYLSEYLDLLIDYKPIFFSCSESDAGYFINHNKMFFIQANGLWRQCGIEIKNNQIIFHREFSGFKTNKSLYNYRDVPIVGKNCENPNCHCCQLESILKIKPISIKWRTKVDWGPDCADCAISLSLPKNGANMSEYLSEYFTYEFEFKPIFFFSS